MKSTATVTIGCDVLMVERFDLMWVSPCNGQQHPTMRDALACEIEACLWSCGEPADEIEGLVTAYLEPIE